MPRGADRDFEQQIVRPLFPGGIPAPAFQPALPADLERPLEFEDVFSVPQIQSLMDDFFALTGIGVAFIDMRGRVLVATGWQDICTKFHRVHPETARNCVASDLELSNGVAPGTYKIYRCKNRMRDMATPIMVGGRQVGNLFLGQFFFDDEPLEESVFRDQAKQYGFDEAAYLDAYRRVPRWSREKVATVMRFYTRLAVIIGNLGYQNLVLAHMLDERKKLVESLQASDARWRFALEGGAEDGVWDWNAATNKVFFSRQWKTMLGYAEDEVGDTLAEWETRVHPDDLPRCYEDLKRHLGGETPVYRNEHRIRCKDGSYKWILDRGKVLERTPDGKPLRIIGTHTDITARKAMEQALLDERRRLMQILNAFPYGVYIVNHACDIEFVNRSLVLEFGPTQGRKCHEYLHGLPSRCPWCQNDKVMRGEIVNWEWHSSKTDRDYELCDLPLRNPDGTISKLEVFRDITERKRAEAEAARAREAAEKANHAKDEFLATMSHELRTPLNPILGFAELLAQAPNLNEEQRLWLTIMRQRGQDLLGLIGQVLDMSRIQTGRLVLERRALALRALVKNAVASLMPAAVKKKLKVSWEVAPDLPDIVLVDGLRLRQILLNLLVNALKFTESGEIAVRVVDGHDGPLSATPASGDRVLRFEVQDTGLGIPHDRQEIIFEAFAHADHEHAVRYGGAGLGLSIARSLVELMGGRMGVQSAPGQGSTFWFTLLAGRAEDGRDRPEAVRVGAVPDAGRPIRILAADDDETSRLLVQALAERAGYTARVVVSGAEALAALEKESFDLVLMDIRMPGMDGVEATRRIRELDHRLGRRTWIVAMTAHAMPGDRDRFLAAGLDDYLAKPIQAADWDALRRRLAESRPPGSAQTSAAG